jgi:hypothetical protein
MTDKKQQFRLERFELLLDTHFEGNRTDLGKFLGYKDGAFVRQMLAGSRPISEKTIEKIESHRIYKGWFSEDSSELNQDEMALIKAYRKINQAGKQVVQTMIRGLVEVEPMEKASLKKTS